MMTNLDFTEDQTRMGRAFIVGNGPSLTVEQLNRLIPEVSFAVNRIHILYDQTRWRPDYYVYMDMSNTTNEIYAPDLAFHTRQGYPCHIRSDIVAKFIEFGIRQSMDDWDINTSMKNIEIVEQCPHIDAERKTVQEWHLPQLCKQGGSVSGAIQLAVMEGFNPIYLIGCDGNLEGNANNHFSADYVDRDSMTVQMAILANKTLELAHQIAGGECKERGVSIFNATVGGSGIGGIPYCDFYELFD